MHSLPEQPDGRVRPLPAPARPGTWPTHGRSGIDTGRVHTGRVLFETRRECRQALGSLWGCTGLETCAVVGELIEGATDAEKSVCATKTTLH